jgi:acyl-CoA thioester hydrolase
VTGFVLTAEGAVPETWIDANGHMNIQWYTAVFDQGCEVLLARVGMTPASVRAGGTTVVAARIATTHRREVMLGETWQLWSGLLDATASSLTFTHRFVAGGVIRAVCHIQSHAFDPQSRGRAELPDAMVTAARLLIVPGVVNPFAPGVQS